MEAGYWNLYRYDPRLAWEGKNPSQLDSAEPKGSFKDFLMSEVRYASLAQKDPVKAEEMFRLAEADARRRYEVYQAMSR